MQVVIKVENVLTFEPVDKKTENTIYFISLKFKSKSTPFINSHKGYMVQGVSSHLNRSSSSSGYERSGPQCRSPLSWHCEDGRGRGRCSNQGQSSVTCIPFNK